MRIIDKLLNKSIYTGDVVDLKERYRTDIVSAYDGVPTVYYDILKHNTDTKVGTIDLRFSIAGEMYYYGHVGYNILKQYRGNKYAYYACKVLFEIAKQEFKMGELIITCSPENIASYKTLVDLNGELVELIDVPSNHNLYKFGETKKYVFKYKLTI